MEKIKISVVIPVYKVDKYLSKCLDNIINQTLKDIEIIVVDEGDLDRCREIIDYYEKIDKRIIAPHKKNGGYGSSCNLGFKLAKGEYIAIVESDDYIELDAFEKMYEKAKKFNADIVKTPFFEYFSNGFKRDCSYRDRIKNSLPSDKCFNLKNFSSLLSVHASIWSCIYKREFLLSKNIYFPNVKGGAYVDNTFRVKSLVLANKIIWYDKPFYNYRVDNLDNTTNNYDISKQINRWVEIFSFFDELNNDLNDYYAKNLVLELYYSVLFHFRFGKVNKEDIIKFRNLVSKINENNIVNSPVLSKEQKNEFLLFNRNPLKYAKNIKIKYCISLIAGNIFIFFDKLFKYNYVVISLFFSIVFLICSESFNESRTVLSVFSLIFLSYSLLFIFYKLIRKFYNFIARFFRKN